MEAEHMGNTTVISLTQEDLAELAAGGTVSQDTDYPPFRQVSAYRPKDSNDYPRASISVVSGTSLTVQVPEGTAFPWTIPRGGIEASVHRQAELMYIYGKTGKVILQASENE